MSEEKSESTSYVGFPTVCYEYISLSLVNREAALAYGNAEWKTKLNSGRKPCSCPR